jgi:DNA-binding HxlR family transcriptional regulator
LFVALRCISTKLAQGGTILSDTHIDVCEGGHSYEERRALADILARIGDKWTVLVVGVLSQGPMRYSQIFKQVEGVSQRMLTLTLKSLERDGLVTRTVYPTNPPRVDYELTERGKTLIVPLHVLGRGLMPTALQSRIPAATSIKIETDEGRTDNWLSAKKPSRMHRSFQSRSL